MRRLMRLKNIAALLLAAALALTLPAAALAGEDGGFFVSDPAGVLSPAAEAEIAGKGEVIFAQTGCRFAVAAVDFLGGESIEDYTAALYEQNRQGDNGLLLVVSAAEESYHIIQGAALEGQLPNSELQSILDRLAEPDFAAGDYQSAIMKVHRELTGRLEGIFSVTADSELYQRQIEELRLENQRLSRLRAVYLAAAAAAGLVALLFAARTAISMFYRAKRRRRSVRRGFKPFT